jgi:hypothetical protein
MVWYYSGSAGDRTDHLADWPDGTQVRHSFLSN